ncbi:exodeoxyribonuclease III [Glycomyces sp. L485]|uniref:exodeoxyribonuclease III n=1 Tax=Glycomyces sp. L485 TaxID=2909235 RepID=UPI001F4AD763|nr:exodeoxyribonuclease III [Glycomyces sp. L485]MCH7231511.1 exodeoxyribonuclease III [Glycomyces sp. L485]
MRVATWNINSVKARLDRLLGWLESAQPDVVCLQELKCAAEEVPVAAIEAAGYEIAAHGTGRWNGVAILSRVGIDDIVRGLEGQPRFAEADEARVIAATCGRLRLWSVYVPNGRDVTDAHFPYKLAFLEALKSTAAGPAAGPAPFAVLGDFNICPSDDDIWDVEEWPGTTHVTKAERAALAEIESAGLTDVFPRALKHAWPFTFWDYRNLDFPKNRGLRIDLALVNAPCKNAVTDAWVDRNERKGKGASDHAPVVLELDL